MQISFAQNVFGRLKVARVLRTVLKRLGFSSGQPVSIIHNIYYTIYLPHEDFSCFPASIFGHSATGCQKDHDSRCNVGDCIWRVGKGFQLGEIDLKKNKYIFKIRGQAAH